MSRPENTSRRPRTDWLFGGNPEAIEAQESEGQRQLVSSDRLPTDTHGTDEDFLALGFTFGPPDPNDPMFRPATLPEGWTREGSDHAMWSYLLDERGLQRVAIFYKAAFYDRRAHMSVQRVGYCVASDAIYGDDAVSVPWEKLTAEEIEDVRGEAEDYLRRAEESPRIYGDRAERAREVLRQVAT